MTDNGSRTMTAQGWLHRLTDMSTEILALRKQTADVASSASEIQVNDRDADRRNSFKIPLLLNGGELEAGSRRLAEDAG